MKAAPYLIVLALGVFACSKGDTSNRAREDFGAAGKSTEALQSAPRAMAPLANQSISIATDAVSAAKADPASSRPASSRAVTAATDSTTSPSMLIRTGQASVEVDKLDPALIKMKQLASQLGGYVANSSLSGGRDQVRSATLELKIPTARYDQAATGLNGIGKLESINTSVEDVGEEYVDIAARVANGHRLEERLVNLLATRTGKLEDVLAVERELARVREEIERYDGRMRFLRTRSAVSTLSVTIHEPIPILGRNPGENPITVAVRQAWRNFVGLVAGTIASLGVLIPLGLVAVGVWYLYRRARRTSAV